MEEKELIGKTIVSAIRKGIEGYDDEPYLELVFNDNTKVTISAGYGMYTGKSEEEYPRYIGIGDIEKVS